MAGRRLKKAVLEVLVNQHPDAEVVIAGLANGYSQYVTTPEEYSIQRYEGASTLFGPNTLPAYIELFTNLTRQLLGLDPVNGPGPSPFDWTLFEPKSLVPDPVIDPIFPNPPGKVLTQPNVTYTIGAEVSVTIVSSDPRNNYKTQDTYLQVQQLISSTWVTVAVDGDWETQIEWTPSPAPGFLSTDATIRWDTSNADPGTYRIVHQGFRRKLLGFQSFGGTTRTFILNE